MTTTPHPISDAPLTEKVPTAPTPTVATPAAPTRHAVATEQRRHFGGFKWGSAFFGWLTAMGTAVLLSAIAIVAGISTGFTTNPETAGAVGITTGIVTLAVLFLAYVCGGYVAGRMARFDGAKQGVAVWVWSILVAALATVLTLIARPRFDALVALDGLPRMPVTPEDMTVTGLIAVGIALVVALVGAVLGGLAGMHYHRKIDRTPLDV